MSEEIEQMEQLLQQAKENYPRGTKYMYKGHNATVNGELQYHKCTSGKYMITDGWGGSVYNKGVWAEIVSYPKDFVPLRIINSFPIY
jgi:hypothetical protein